MKEFSFICLGPIRGPFSVDIAATFHSENGDDDYFDDRTFQVLCHLSTESNRIESSRVASSRERERVRKSKIWVSGGDKLKTFSRKCLRFLLIDDKVKRSELLFLRIWCGRFLRDCTTFGNHHDFDWKFMPSISDVIDNWPQMEWTNACVVRAGCEWPEPWIVQNRFIAQTRDVLD